MLFSTLFFIVIFAQDTNEILKKRSSLPLMEIDNFSIYEADTNLVTQHLNGIKALRYETYDVIYDSMISKIAQNNLIEHIYGEEITHNKNRYYFKKDGIYTRSDGLTFLSKGVFDSKLDVFLGEDKFYLYNQNGSELFGSNVIYNQGLKTINASNIKGVFTLESKDKKWKNFCFYALLIFY